MAPKSAFRRTIISRSQAARPTLADLRAYDQGAGEEWRVESFGYDRFASLPFDRVAAYLVDGVVTQYSVYVTDAQGGFYVWSENLDRALELQFKEGRPSTFNLRNYAIDLDNLPEAQAAEGSAYRAEIMSVDEFRFAAALSGVEFRPDVLYATYDATTGFLEYRTGAGDGAPVHDGTGYASVVTPTLGLVDTLTCIITHDASATTVAGTAGEELRSAAGRRRRMRGERNVGRPAGRRSFGRRFCCVRKSKLRWGVNLRMASLSI